MERWGICFSGIWCIYILSLFAVADAFLTTDVSALPWYSLLQMLFFRPIVSATCSSLDLQMFFSLPGMYNCIYILLFLGFEDTSFANFTSASHIFYDLRMLLIEILHPQPALSRPCGYSQVKFCFFVHLIYDNVLRKNIGYKFHWIRRKRLEILKGQNFTLELRNLLFEGVAQVAGF